MLPILNAVRRSADGDVYTHFTISLSRTIRFNSSTTVGETNTVPSASPVHITDVFHGGDQCRDSLSLRINESFL